MNAHKQHKSLVDKYNYAVKFVKKLGLYGGVMQVGIIGFAYSWKHVPLDYYKIAFPILVCLSIYFLVKDFRTLLRIEGNMTQMILEGVELEKKNNGLGKFFHGLLQSFNFTNTLIQRSLINVLALGGLGYLVFQFIGSEIPDIKISRWFLSVFVWMPAVIACKLYYDALKVLDEAKEKVFSKQN
jgi:hypothetical protein